jgi:acyl carrier protein
MKNAYRIMAKKPEEKRQLGIQKRRCVDNIKMDLRDIEWGGMDSIDLVFTVINLRVP